MDVHKIEEQHYQIFYCIIFYFKTPFVKYSETKYSTEIYVWYREPHVENKYGVLAFGCFIINNVIFCMIVRNIEMLTVYFT